jgi:methylated-DNA-protein-cysteine methyltransferase related protein
MPMGLDMSQHSSSNEPGWAYGAIAAMAGSPRGARQVVRILHTLSEKEKLPWHRVVNRDGRISLPMEGVGGEQRRRLLKEGVAVSAAGALDMEKFGWRPGGTGKPPPRVRRPAP